MNPTFCTYSELANNNIFLFVGKFSISKACPSYDFSILDPFYLPNSSA
jgi:hypothetical protein